MGDCCGSVGHCRGRNRCICGYAVVRSFPRNGRDGSDQRESEREVVYKIIYIGEPVTIALPPEEKAEVAHESGARIVVPAGAVAEETTVSVAEVEPPTGALRVDRAYDFSVGDAELLEAVTVHIPFELDEGQDLSGIYALHWNEDEGAWEPVSGTVDESAGTIAVETPSLSIFSWAWIKVDATCEASPGTVDAGERITISSKGTSLTRHDINIYMRPDIKWEFEGDQYPHDTDALTQIKSIGKDDQFELTYQSTLDAEGIYIIQCRLFWETVGPDVELGEPGYAVCADNRQGSSELGHGPRQAPSRFVNRHPRRTIAFGRAGGRGIHHRGPGNLGDSCPDCGGVFRNTHFPGVCTALRGGRRREDLSLAAGGPKFRCPQIPVPSICAMTSQSHRNRFRIP